MAKGAYDSGGGVKLSSIALLQERFRQLEKMKELRQEKELLRMLSESERYSPPNDPNRHSKTCLSSMMTMFDPPKPHECRLSLSLWPDSPTKPLDSLGKIHQAPLDLDKSWFADATLVCTAPSSKIENSHDSDIDTSLRL